jgi:hypothetical protein
MVSKEVFAIRGKRLDNLSLNWMIEYQTAISSHNHAISSGDPMTCAENTPVSSHLGQVYLQMHIVSKKCNA